MTNFISDNWFILLLITGIILYEVYNKLKERFLKKDVNEKIIIRKNIRDLSIDNQIKLVKAEQNQVRKQLEELEIKKNKLLGLAEMNQIRYEYLDKINRIR